MPLLPAGHQESAAYRRRAARPQARAHQGSAVYRLQLVVPRQQQGGRVRPAVLLPHREAHRSPVVELRQQPAVHQVLAVQLERIEQLTRASTPFEELSHNRIPR